MNIGIENMRDEKIFFRYKIRGMGVSLNATIFKANIAKKKIYI